MFRIPNEIGHRIKRDGKHKTRNRACYAYTEESILEGSFATMKTPFRLLLYCSSQRPTGRPKACWEDDVKKRYTEVKSAKLENPCLG
jgi:hypothetical protein